MFKLIKNSCLSENEIRLVQTDVDYSDKTKLFELAKSGLVKYFGRANKETVTEDTSKTFSLDEKDNGDREVNFTGFRNKASTYPRGKGNFRGNNYGNGSIGGFRNGGNFTNHGSNSHQVHQNQGQVASQGQGGCGGQWGGAGQGGRYQQQGTQILYCPIFKKLVINCEHFSN